MNEFAHFTLYEKSCCSINADMQQRDDGVVATAATKKYDMRGSKIYLIPRNIAFKK